MYWQEVPYRAASVVRAAAQRHGLLAAHRVPDRTRAPRASAWCHVPVGDTNRLAVARAANEVLAGRLHVLGRAVPTRDGIPDWNADPITGRRIAPTFGLYLDFRHIGPDFDIKFLWEVNRHLWWLPLAQHHALTGDAACLNRLRTLLTSWLDECPYALGANWCSPIEHGIRLINWSAVWHLIGGVHSPMFGDDAGRRLLDRWLESIYQHMSFISDNYSLYSSADNHLIGEAAGVFVGAHTWDCWDPARALGTEAKSILQREALRQFTADGVNHEQAIWYHTFALEFLLVAGLCGRANGDDFAPGYWARLERGATFIASLMDCRGAMPTYGDSDDSEVLRLGHGPQFGSHRSLIASAAVLFQRADLQAKFAGIADEPDQQTAWLMRAAAPAADPHAMARLPRVFPQGGYAVLGTALHSPEEFRVIFDCGPLGANRVAGHGHADALSMTLSWAGVPLLVDPGTYCYNAEPALRHFFRATRAHNTLVVDGKDQSDYGASFLWLRDVNSTLIDETGDGAQSVHASHDGYARLADPVIHHRRVSLDEALVVEDWLDCRSPHDVELLWHGPAHADLTRVSDHAWRLEAAGRCITLTIEGAAATASVIRGRESPPQGWVSARFYERQPAPVLSVRAWLSPHQVLRTVIRRHDAGADPLPT
jgi:hypothetical protein